MNCLILDEVKEAYLARHEIMSRRELDAQHQNDSTNVTVEQIITQCYNDNNFKPVSLKLPSLYEDFIEEYDLSLANVPWKVTPGQVKRWLADRG